MIRLVPCSLADAKRIVRDWHSHHDPMVGHRWSTCAIGDRDELLGCVVVSNPIAEANNDGFTFEVTRLCCKGHSEEHRALPSFLYVGGAIVEWKFADDGNEDTKHAASKLLAAACTAAEMRGIRLMLSYTRIDEDGTCYRAAGWVPQPEIVKARDWTSGNKATRWLPGFYEPTTEKIDRIRWEWRPPSAIRAVCKMIHALGLWSCAAQRRRAA